MKIEINNIKLNINKKQLVLLSVNVILVVAFLVLGISAKNAVKALYSQQEADRWEDEKNSYAQVSAFASPSRNLQEEDVTLIRSSVMEELSKDALNKSDGDSRVWIDAYSGECRAEFRKENNTLSVTAVGVGGDFFQFHPIPLLSGSYISEEDLNQDRIVVDENFAWAMFGSNDIVGMQVWMGNRIYTIAGVVAVDENSLYRTAYGDNNRIYMSYNQLKGQQEGLTITCYEAVMPNPISNYSFYALRKACGIEEEEEDTIKETENPLNFEDIEVIENSNRFKTMKLLEGFKNRKLNVMRPNSVGYPVWENLARVEEQRQQNLLVLRLVLLVCPCICLVLWLYGLWKRRTWFVKNICVSIIDRVRERQEEKAEEKWLELEMSEEDASYPKAESESDEESILQDKTESDEKKSPDLEEELQSVTSEDIFQI